MSDSNLLLPTYRIESGTPASRFQPVGRSRELQLPVCDPRDGARKSKFLLSARGTDSGNPNSCFRPPGRKRNTFRRENRAMHKNFSGCNTLDLLNLSRRRKNVLSANHFRPFYIVWAGIKPAHSHYLKDAAALIAFRRGILERHILFVLRRAIALVLRAQPIDGVC